MNNLIVNCKYVCHPQIIKVGDESKGLRAHRSDICRISYEVKIKDSDVIVEKRDEVKIYLGDNEVRENNNISSLI